MLSEQTFIDLDAACRRAIARIAECRRCAIAVLLLIGIVCYLPGLVSVPPVDRTEIYFAQVSQQMAETGDLLAAPTEPGAKRTKPIGTYWMQTAAAEIVSAIAGPDALGAIATYRVPSLIGSLVAIALIYLLLGPLIGRPAALSAAALYAVIPIVALHAQLAIVEGIFQPFVVAAQLALLRIYAAREGESTRGLALLFWTAQGASTLFNALALPMLSIATLVALFAFDRRLGWLKRLEPLWGVPLMLVIAALSLAIPTLAGGASIGESLSLQRILAALGGAQQQEWKALPGSFTLALVLGFLPGTLLLIAATADLWRNRAMPVASFVLASVIGYLVYLELLSSNPALYTVQLMFPAMATGAAVYLKHAGEAGGQGFRIDRWVIVLGALLGFLVVPGIVIALHAITATTPRLDAIVALIAFVAACGLAALTAWRGLPSAWLVLSVASFMLFHVLLFGLVLPRLDTAWPAAHVRPAVASARQCAPGPVAIAGFREPSLPFVIGSGASLNEAGEVADRMQKSEPGLALVGENAQGLLAAEIERRGLNAPTRLGCVDAIDFMLGCRISFAIYATGAARADCKLPDRFACKEPVKTPFKACKRPKSDPFLK